MNNKGFSLQLVLRSFRFAFRGVRVLFREEHNAWVHLVVAALVVAAGFIFRISLTEWGLVAIAIGAVFVSETFNSALERLCDAVQPEQDRRIGDIKDLCAAAVLLCAIAAAAIGLLIFIPKILALL
jgi:Diacylglycerol kinase